MRYLRKHVGFALMGRSLLGLRAELCPSFGAGVRLLTVYGMLVINAFSRRTRKPRARRLRIRVGGRDRDWWVADPMELAALSEVFVAGQYGDWLPAQQPQLIVDAGANVGSATLWFRARFPQARVIAIEPNPEAFERLQRNVAHDPNVEVVNAAVASADGKQFLLCGPMTPVSRLQGHRAPGAVEVDALTLETVRDRFAAGERIDVLKLDVEGAEWGVLARPVETVGTIVLEVHAPVPGERDPDAVLAEVAEREGFELRQGYSDTTAPEKLRWLVRTEIAVAKPERVDALAAASG